MNRWFGLPLIASEHGSKVDNFILIIHAVILVAFLGWAAWLVTALIKFRRARHPRADYHGLQTHLPHICVAILAATEGVLLGAFAIPFWHDEIVAAPDPARVKPFEVHVIGQQFQWNVHYPGPDGVFGRTDPSLVDDVLNPLGLDNKDPAAEDDISTLNLLHLPLGRMAQIGLSSKDVIHGFFLPEFRVKQDAIPGMRVPVSFRPMMSTAEFRTKTNNPQRDFEIACAQLCGINHYTMRGFVTVESQEDFDKWYSAQLEQKKKYAGDDWWVDQKSEGTKDAAKAKP